MSSNCIPPWSPHGSVLVTRWRGLLAPVNAPSRGGSWLLLPTVLVDSPTFPLPVLVADKAGGLTAVGELTSWTLDRTERTLRGSGIVEAWAILDHLDEYGRAPALPMMTTMGSTHNGLDLVESAVLHAVLLGDSAWDCAGVTIGPEASVRSLEDRELARAC